MNAERPPPLSADQRRYWLRNCQGFRVEGPAGKVGIVEDVLFGPDPTEPAALFVRAGFLGTRMEVLGVEAITAIDPQRMLITIERVTQH